MRLNKFSSFFVVIPREEYECSIVNIIVFLSKLNFKFSFFMLFNACCLAKAWIVLEHIILPSFVASMQLV